MPYLCANKNRFNMITIKENNMVDAREIYNYIEVKSRFNGWVTESLEFIGAKEGNDFCRKNGKSTGGRPSIEYDVTVDCAKELCLTQRSEKSKQLRLWLISLSNKIIWDDTKDNPLGINKREIDERKECYLSAQKCLNS